MCRLVKGAYWDAEIKRSQERGLPGYPVFTRKPNTDVSFLACARVLLEAALGTTLVHEHDRAARVAHRHEQRIARVADQIGIHAVEARNPSFEAIGSNLVVPVSGYPKLFAGQPMAPPGTSAAPTIWFKKSTD